MPVAKLMHRNKHNYSSSNSSSGVESSSLSHDDDSIQQPLDSRDIHEQYPVGTAVKKWFKNGHGWCKGVIVSVTGSSSNDNKIYKVQYDNSESTGEKVHAYSACEMPKLVKTAAVEPGTRLEVFWPHEKSWFPATVEQERMQKRENYLVSYDGKTDREWIDLHRHKIRVLQQPIYNKKLAGKPHPREVVVRKSSSHSNNSLPRRETSFDRQSSMNSQTSSSSFPPKPPAESSPTAAVPSEAEANILDQSTSATRIPKNDSHEDDWGDNNDGKNVAEKPAAVLCESSVDYGISPSSSTSNRSVVQALDHGMTSPPVLHVQTESMVDVQKRAERVVSTSSQPAGLSFVTNDDFPTVESQTDAEQTSKANADNTEPVENAKNNAIPNDDGSTEEGIILDPVNDPATMSAVYSLIGIGSRISIYIEEDGTFYNATVTDRKLRGKPFYVEYEDGDEGWIDLRQHRIRLFPQSAPEYCGERVVGGKRLRRVSGKDNNETSKNVDTAVVSAADATTVEKSNRPANQLKRVARKSIATLSTVETSVRKIERDDFGRGSDDDDDDDETSKNVDTAVVSAADATAGENSNRPANQLKRVARKSIATLSPLETYARKIERDVVSRGRDDNDDDDDAYGSAYEHASLAADSDSENAGTDSSVQLKDRKGRRNMPPKGRKHATTFDTKTYDLSKIRVGFRVAVWWEDDEQYYNATVKRERSHQKPFFIEYDDDGKGEWIDFAEHNFKILSTMPAERKRRGRPSNREDPSRVRIGSRVAVWWASASTFLEGTVTKKRKHDHPYFIEYDQGEAGHWIDFAKHTFRLLDDVGDGKSRRASRTTIKQMTSSKDAGSDYPKFDEHPKKKRKKSPENPIKESGDALDDLEITVGSRVAVYWEGDSKYYEGVVTKVRKSGRKRHYLVYDDGEAAHWIDFKEHWVRVLPDQTPKKQNNEKAKEVTTRPKVKSRAYESGGDESATKLSPRARAAERARLLANIGVGMSVEIWWSGDDCYYKGEVIREGKEKHRFYVRYEDGEEEWVNFSRQTFRLPTEVGGDSVEDDVSNVEASEDEPVDDACSGEDSSDEDVDETHKYTDFVFGVVDDVRVGSKLAVWWPGEKKYFEGKVAKIDNSRKPYFLKYKDGDEEWTDLRRRYFRIL